MQNNFDHTKQLKETKTSLTKGHTKNDSVDSLQIYPHKKNFQSETESTISISQQRQNKFAQKSGSEEQKKILYTPRYLS